MKELLCVPSEYDGQFEDFYNKYIEPNLPDPKSVKIAHQILIKYLKTENPLYILRNFIEYSQSGHVYSVNNLKFMVGDNEPALWFYAKACNNSLRLEDSFEYFIKTQAFPISFSTDSKKNENKSEWKTWSKEKWEIGFSTAGWFHAHLFDAAKNINTTINHDNLRMRMLRFLHPANHFPMPSHYPGRYKSNLALKDMSEQDGIKSFILNKYKERYSDIWDEFISIANLKDEKFENVVELKLSYVTYNKDNSKEEKEKNQTQVSHLQIAK